jgi:hypothetical protein
MLMTDVWGDDIRVENVLRPFRETLRPIVDKSVSVPNLCAASHMTDANFGNTPNRLNIQGVNVSDIWKDVTLEVWDRWCKFTENEDCKRTLIFWDIFKPQKVAEVGSADTAFSPRDPHYHVMIHGAYVKCWRSFLLAIDSLSFVVEIAVRSLTRALERLSHPSFTMFAKPML